MKKVMVLILAAALACGLLAGCGGGGISQSEYDAVVSERDTLQRQLDELTGQATASVPSSSETQDPAAPLDADMLLLDQDGVKITFKGLGSDWSGPEIKLQIENSATEPITIQARNMSINGIMMDGIFSCDVMPGKIANDGISLLESSLEENNISEITEIEFSFHIFNSETWDTILDSDSIIIQL